MSNTPHITSTEFETRVLGSDKPVLVDFWAPWCGPCRYLAPTVDRIAEEYQGRVDVVKVNLDDAQDLATRYRVFSIPTLMVFLNGKPEAGVLGNVPHEVIVRMLAPFVSADANQAEVAAEVDAVTEVEEAAAV